MTIIDAATERYCPCGTRMSTLNRGDRCFACAEGARVPAAKIADIWTQPAKGQKSEPWAQVERRERIIEVIRTTLPPTFTSVELAEAMGFPNQQTAANYLKRMVVVGKAEVVERRKTIINGQTRQMALWRLV